MKYHLVWYLIIKLTTKNLVYCLHTLCNQGVARCLLWSYIVVSLHFAWLTITIYKFNPCLLEFNIDSPSIVSFGAKCESREAIAVWWFCIICYAQFRAGDRNLKPIKLKQCVAKYEFPSWNYLFLFYRNLNDSTQICLSKIEKS